MKKIFFVLLLIISIGFLFGCTDDTGSKNPTNPNPTPEVIEYKVDIFYDEAVQSTINIEANTHLSKPNNPTKDGYVFDNWYVDYFFTEVFDFNKPITGDLTIYGRFLKECIITFANADVDNRIVLEGNKLDMPANPTKTGYIFDGWYTDSTFSSPFDFTNIISSDLTLYAKFKEEIYYTVTFNTQGGTTIENIQILKGDILPLPENPTKDNFVFVGWYLDNNYTEVWDAETLINANITLYAKWSEKDPNKTYYTVTFDSQGGSSIAALEVEQYSIIEEPEAPIRDGYIFDGWYTDIDCTTYWNFNIKEVEGNLTLYAKWIEYGPQNSYTITFVYNNGQENTTSYTNNLITVPNNPSYTGHEFAGWYTDLDCTNAWNFNTAVTSNLTLYAKWTIKTVNISFAGADISSQTINYGQLVTKPNDPIKEGYRFTGWYSNINDEILFDFNETVHEDVIITAGWIKTYKISFVSEYGSFEDMIVDENSVLPKLPMPSYSNQIFIGWFIDSSNVNPNSIVDRDLTLTAKWEPYNLGTDNISIIDYNGYYEAAYVELNYVNGYSKLSDYKISYKLSSEQNFTKVDDELIRLETSTIRCDILGLASGNYDILIEVGDKQRTLYNVAVSNYDREGYAHFNYSGTVGAYNNDGTVMDDAIIIYVTDETKNSVTLTVGNRTYTGIAEILQYQYKFNKPLIVRIIGKINAATWNSITYSKGNSNLTASQILDKDGNQLPTQNMNEGEIIAGGYNSMSTDLNNGITKLNGLTNKIKYSSGEFDSYYNMLDISSAKNVTVEGVGTDATLYQWGFTWKNCSYIEVRNLTFDDYTEDACSFEGSDESTTIAGFSTGHIWIHHNTFNRGKNNWDVCPEQDKLSGDGATDLKCNAFITISYNHYYNCKKTGLVGGGDSQKTACITFHHNFYDQNGSRLPLGRQANMHMYNNYYYKNNSVMSLRAGAYAFVENCVFDNCSSTISLASSAAKLYNNTFSNCKGVSGTQVTDRTTVVSNNNIYGPTFDTDSSIFYYDSTNKKTDVDFMLDTDEVASFCKKYAGVLKENFTPYTKDLSNNTNTNTPNTDNDVDNDTVTKTVILTLNSFSAATVSSATTVNGITIYPKTGKTVKVNTCNETLAGTSITKYISFGGGSLIEKELCIEFATEKKANITVYYASGAAGRYVNIISSSDRIVAETPTQANSSTIVNYTFTNLSAGTYSVASSNSSIDIYCIVIEYLE